MEHMDTYVVIKRYMVESDSAEDALRTVDEAPIQAEGLYVQRVEDGWDVEVAFLVSPPEEPTSDDRLTEALDLLEDAVLEAEQEEAEETNAMRRDSLHSHVLGLRIAAGIMGLEVGKDPGTRDWQKLLRNQPMEIVVEPNDGRPTHGTTTLPKSAEPYVERADTDLPSHPTA
jgi:hypothetical protein